MPSRVCCCCFSDDGLVDMKTDEGTRTATVAEVQPGDSVRTSQGFQCVVYIHRGGETKDVIQVEFETVDGEKGSIGLTPQHLIYTTGDSVKKACDLQLGDPLQVRGGPASVTSLSPAAGAVRSLVTANGEVLVNGVRVSSYAFNERLHHLTQGVAWLGRVDARLPDTLCRVASPAVTWWVFPLLFEDVHETKKTIKAAEKEAKAAEKQAKGTPESTPKKLLHTLSSLRRLNGSIAA